MLQMKNLIGGCLVVLALGSAAKADLVAVNYSGASITGLWNTQAGGAGTVSNAYTGTTYADCAGYYPSGEAPIFAIDGDLGTKYLAWGDNNGAGNATTTAGLDTGFYVTLPTAAKVTAIRFATANDAPTRDPLSITIEGSNATGTDLLLANSWNSLYSGVTGLLNYEDRFVYGDIESFSNSTAYTSYRVLVTAARSTGEGAGTSGQCAVQYGEVKLFTGTIPEPSSLALITTGVFALLAYAWRKRK